MAPLRAIANWTALALAFLVSSSHGAPSDKNNTYDYIVVGSGPGGGTLASTLARSGHSVLLLEAGDDQSANVLTQIPVLAAVEQIDNSLHWDFFVRHYSDQARTLRHHFLTWRLPDGSFWVGSGANPPAGAKPLGVYYPRGATLGGSAVINYLVDILPPASDWQNIATLTGDHAWRYSSFALRGVGDVC